MCVCVTHQVRHINTHALPLFVYAVHVCVRVCVHYFQSRVHVLTCGLILNIMILGFRTTVPPALAEAAGIYGIGTQQEGGGRVACDASLLLLPPHVRQQIMRPRVSASAAMGMASGGPGGAGGDGGLAKRNSPFEKDGDRDRDRERGESDSESGVDNGDVAEICILAEAAPPEAPPPQSAAHDSIPMSELTRPLSRLSARSHDSMGIDLHYATVTGMLPDLCLSCPSTPSKDNDEEVPWRYV